jgi:hypothetical protein
MICVGVPTMEGVVTGFVFLVNFCFEDASSPTCFVLTTFTLATLFEQLPQHYTG